MCYSVIAIANYFIDKSKETGIPVTNFRLQKMSYFAHAAYFCDNHKPLVKEPVMAWQHGPVFPDLYITIKDFGSNPIDGNIPIFELDENGLMEIECPRIKPNDEEVKDYLDKVWDICSEMDIHKLRRLSHQKNGAWYKTVKEIGLNPLNDNMIKNQLPKDLYIPNEYIEKCGM